MYVQTYLLYCSTFHFRLAVFNTWWWPTGPKTLPNSIINHTNTYPTYNSGRHVKTVDYNPCACCSINFVITSLLYVANDVKHLYISSLQEGGGGGVPVCYIYHQVLTFLQITRSQSEMQKQRRVAANVLYQAMWSQDSWPVSIRMETECYNLSNWQHW
jgi:hypothetical protein